MYRLLSFLLLYVLLQTVNTQLKSCFYHGGEASPDFPCDPEAETSTCCGGDWICGTNLYCVARSGEKSLGSCTDSNWNINNNPSCPFALNIGRYAKGMDLFDYDLNVTRCTDTRTYCPNNNFSASNETCCERNQGITEINFQNNVPLPEAKADLSSYYASAGLTIPTDGVYKTATLATATTSTSGTATSSSTASSPTTTVASAPTSAGPSPTPTPSSGLSTGAKAGIGAGAAAGVLIIAAAAIFLWMRRRRTLRLEREKAELFSYPQYSGVPQGHVSELGPTTGDYYKSSELPSEAIRIELDSQTCGPGLKK